MCCTCRAPQAIIAANPDGGSKAMDLGWAMRRKRTLLIILANVLLAAPLAYAATTDFQDSLQLTRGTGSLEDMRRAPRPIAGIDSIWIEELTWMEVRDEIATGKTVGIIAAGGIEQNGPYLAGGKHNYVLEAMCAAIAHELGNALCAPIIRYVPQGDPRNVPYPGTLSVREETFRMVLEDVANSLKSQGFTDIVLIGDSGGNQNGMDATAIKLNRHWDGAARAYYIGEYYWKDIWSCMYLKEQLNIVQKPDNCSAVRDRYHDDVHYSSIVAATDPSRIRARQRIEAGLYSINGVELESAEKTIAIGRKLIEYRTAITVRAIRAWLGSE